MAIIISCGLPKPIGIQYPYEWILEPARGLVKQYSRIPGGITPRSTPYGLCKGEHKVVGGYWKDWQWFTEGESVVRHVP